MGRSPRGSGISLSQDIVFLHRKHVLVCGAPLISSVATSSPSSEGFPFLPHWVPKWGPCSTLGPVVVPHLSCSPLTTSIVHSMWYHKNCSWGLCLRVWRLRYGMTLETCIFPLWYQTPFSEPHSSHWPPPHLCSSPLERYDCRESQGKRLFASSPSTPAGWESDLDMVRGKRFGKTDVTD